jgi:Arc/MetJ family transcription regulator
VHKKAVDNAYDYSILYAYGGYMRTTLVLPDKLVSEAMEITSSPTKTELIKIALENLIQREKVKGIADYFGKVNLNIDIVKMRKR